MQKQMARVSRMDVYKACSLSSFTQRLKKQSEMRLALRCREAERHTDTGLKWLMMSWRCNGRCA